MTDILNMEYSLQTVVNLIGLIKRMDMPFLPNVYFFCDYPFLDAHAYFAAVRGCWLSNPTDELKKMLWQHLDMANSLVGVMGTMEKEIDERLVECYYRCVAYSAHDAYWLVDEMKVHCKMAPSNKWWMHSEDCIDHCWISINRWFKEIEQQAIITADQLFETVGSIAEELKKLLDDTSEETGNAQPPKQIENTDTPPPPQPLHFTRSFTDTERQNLFDRLVSEGFIPKDTNHNHFNYVFGGAETADFKPMQWTGTIKELHYFVTKHFPKQKNQWETTVKCFLWNNQTINKNSLSTAIDKYDNLPEKATIIDNLL